MLVRQIEHIELSEGPEITEEDLGFLQQNRGTSAPEIKDCAIPTRCWQGCLLLASALASALPG